MQKSDSTNVDQSFTNAYRTYYPYLVKYCIARLQGNVDDAEDCTQEAFYILYKKYSSNIDIENPKAFLIKTANNVIMKKLSSKIKNTYSINEVKTNSEDITKNDSFSQIEYNELVKTIAEKLVEPDKTVFNLRYVEEKSLKEISQITGISITNLTTRIYRFRNKVQKEINKWREV